MVQMHFGQAYYASTRGRELSFFSMWVLLIYCHEIKSMNIKLLSCKTLRMKIQSSPLDIVNSHLDVVRWQVSLLKLCQPTHFLGFMVVEVHACPASLSP